MKRSQLQHRSGSLFALAVALVLAILLASPMRDLENGAGLELLYALRGFHPAPKQVVIITLDSTSARTLGLSERPERWPRALHARLVDGLADRGARVIGFDVHFEQAREPGGDQALAVALRRAGNVVLVEQISRDVVHGPHGEILGSVDRRVEALPMLRDAAWASGPFIMPKTRDGVFEFWGLVPSAGDQASLPMLMARRMATPGSLLADNSRRVLNLYGPPGSIRTIPYTEALALVADPNGGAEAFAGKAVLVGFSEFNQSRQADAFRSPYSTEEGLDVSGVELCATAVGNLLEGSGLWRPESGEAALLTLLWSALLTLPWCFARTRRALMMSGALALGYVAAAAWAFAPLNMWLPVILPGFFAPLVVGLLGLLMHLGVARRRERELVHALDLGLTRKGSAAIEALLRGREGRTAYGVCLCSDIESYTALSESLSPEQTRDALSRYFSRFIPVVEAHGGHVMDIVGDSVLSLWLADDSASEACRLACTAALELHGLMNGCSDGSALKTRFGLHCGPLFLGELGSTHHREIRAVGDIVNTSSRIQGANKALGTRILASAEVVMQAPPSPSRSLGRFVLVGKTRAVDLHEIRAEPLSVEVAGAFSSALAGYLSGATEHALRYFEWVLSELGDDGPTHFFLARCRAQQAGGTTTDAEGCVVLGSK